MPDPFHFLCKKATGRGVWQQLALLSPLKTHARSVCVYMVESGEKALSQQLCKVYWHLKNIGLCLLFNGLSTLDSPFLLEP